MSQSTEELTRLFRLLAYTTSSNDHEALVAIRKANALLASWDITWEEFVLTRPKTTETTRPAGQPPPVQDASMSR